jgi:hypothetical protein
LRPVRGQELRTLTGHELNDAPDSLGASQSPDLSFAKPGILNPY